MKRREFFRNASLGAVATSFILPFQSCTPTQSLVNGQGKGRKAKNIIFMVSDGMSSGTLTLADLFLRRKEGRGSFWMDLYRNQRASRALMDTASFDSLVTDSAAGSSSWGSGHRVPNGHLNVGAKGEQYKPILQKFKEAGKKVGCVTTVPITHATPAGFCINNKSRNGQEEIAVDYLTLRFDVMMGGGSKYFNERADKRDLFEEHKTAGFHVVRDRNSMLSLNGSAPVMGVFDTNGLPYEIDRINDAELSKTIPSLADMTIKSIELMKDHKAGFVIQVEGGKVDWAAHANDAPALVYEQAAFDEAVKVAVEFAEKDGNTLVIITTDHGNSNPGLYYGTKADANFDKFMSTQHSNDFVLNSIKKDETPDDIIQKVKAAQNFDISLENAQELKSKYLYTGGDGVYNPYKLPFKEYGEMMAKHTSVAFGSMEHSGDFVELAMFGPGSEQLKPFMVNTELHNFMLEAAEVENKF